MSENGSAKHIGEILDEVSTKIPTLISGIMKTLYSAEAGKNMGQAVGNFYKELINEGFPQEEALKMSKDYLMSLRDIANSVTNNKR